MLVIEHGLGRVRSKRGERVLLLPGQWHFSNHGGQIRTLLGSCVALVVWHAPSRQGGMCHFLLPKRAGHEPHHMPDGRYGTEAVAMLVAAMRHGGTQPQQYTVHLFGGADTMPGHAKVAFNIGARNIEQAIELIDRHGMQLDTVDVGGNEPRHVLLDLADGAVQLRRGHSYRVKEARA